MADAMSFKLTTDWLKAMDAPLNSALYVSRDVFKRSAFEACKHALILMAKSARRLTKTSLKQRKVLVHEWATKVMGKMKKHKYVECWQQGSTSPKRVYQSQFDPDSANQLEGSWDRAKHIKNSGLGKRSWMWQFGEGKKFAGATVLIQMGQNGNDDTSKPVGLILINKLAYLLKILPSGWDKTCADNAVKNILGQTAKRLGLAFQDGMKQQRAA